MSGGILSFGMGLTFPLFWLHICKCKGKKTNTMINYHETDKNGLFLSMTGNRVKILKEELKKDKLGNKERSIKYKSNYTNKIKEISFNPHKVQYKKHTKTNITSH